MVKALDAQAVRLGISRTELLRRRLVEAASTATGHLAAEDLARSAQTFRDATDPSVMGEAWR